MKEIDDVYGLTYEYNEIKPFARGGQGDLYVARPKRENGSIYVFKKIISQGNGGEDLEDYFYINYKISRFEQLLEIKKEFSQDIFCFPISFVPSPAGYIMKKINDSYKTIFDIINNKPCPEVEKSFDKDKRIGILLKITEALGNLHEKDYIYCDLNPKNVMLNEEGDCLLVDTDNIIKEKENNRTISFPDFSHPELGKNKKNDKQSDLYSLVRLIKYFLFPQRSSEASAGTLTNTGNDPDRKNLSPASIGSDEQDLNNFFACLNKGEDVPEIKKIKEILEKQKNENK